MAEQQTGQWGGFSRLIVAAIAAMVLSLALKPYQSKLSPYLKRIKESRIANISFDPSTSEKRTTTARTEESSASRKREVDLVDAGTGKPADKLTDKDKTQLKSVLDKL